MSNEIQLTQEEVDLAASQEENHRLQAQVEYFGQRLVVLRATVNHQAKALEELRAKLGDTAEEDEKNQEESNDGADS